MSDTPETDAAWNAAPTDDTEFANAGWAFARELERERNRAMEQRLCECSFEDACRFAIERDALREENRKLLELGSKLNASLDSLAWLDGHETPNDAERLVMEWKQLFPELK